MPRLSVISIISYLYNLLASTAKYRRHPNVVDYYDYIMLTKSKAMIRI